MLTAEVIGNIGQDAEIKEFNGNKYVSFSVAHSEYSKDAQGNRVEQTVWVSVLWYGDGGNRLQYLKKGTKVFARGRLKVRTYTDKQGNSQVAINVNAGEVELCGFKQDAAPQAQCQQPTRSTPYQQPVQQTDDLPF